MIDVIIPIFRDVAGTKRCIDAVLATHDGLLGRLLLIEDCGPEAEMRPMLRALRRTHREIRLLENEENLGFVGSANRGLLLHEGDVVVLNSDTVPSPGWLAALASAMATSHRIAAVSPLSNNGTLCSVPDYCSAIDATFIDPTRLNLKSLPQFTEMPTAVGFCMMMRGAVLDEIGAFDPKYGRGYNEENDWCQRARSRGYLVGRSNRAYVAHVGQVSFREERNQLETRNLLRLRARYPDYIKDNQKFSDSPEARLAAEYVRLAMHNHPASSSPETGFTHQRQAHPS